MDYRFSTSTTAPPASGYIQLNNATASAATVLSANNTTNANNDATLPLNAITIGSTVFLQDKTDATRLYKYTVTAAPTNQGTYTDIPVSWVSSGTGAALTNNESIYLGISVAGQPGPTGPQGPAGATGAQGPTGATGSQGMAGPVGMTWRGQWTSGVTYVPTDAVYWRGRSYVSKTTNTTSVPAPNGTADWDPLALGFRWRGAWASGATYEAFDAVSSAGSSWVVPIGGAVAAGGAPPESNAAWQQLASVGAQGAAGATGATGPQGTTGATGATGPQGPIGNTGPTGAQGPQGIQGPIGPTGATGTQGPAGPATYASIGTTAPASPAVGQLWWRSDQGRLFLWYDDGTSQQWVPATA